MRCDELVGARSSSVGVQVGDDDMRASRCQRTRRRPADPAGCAGHERDPARQLSARRSLRELVALERPVLDRERLALAERAKAAGRVGRVLHGDRAVVQVTRGSRPRGVGAARDDPDAGNERDTGPDGIDRELPRLVVDVALVVVAVPAAVLRDALRDRGRELVGAVRVGIEADDERLVLGVDQVVGARRPDLAHFRRSRRRSKRQGLGAAVDLEDDAVLLLDALRRRETNPH